MSSCWICVGFNHLISTKCEWNNCFIKSAKKYREFFPTLFVKITDFQLVVNFEQMYIQLPYLDSMVLWLI